MIAILFAIPACQKKEIASEAGYGAAGGAGIRDVPAARESGKQDLGGQPADRAPGRQPSAPPRGWPSKMRTSIFAYDSSALTPQAQDILRKKAAFMKANRNVKVTIEGHTRRTWHQ